MAVAIYLNRKSDEKVFMELPDLLEEILPLYGLKQADRQWHKKSGKVMKRLSLKYMESDPCVYVT